MATYKITEYVVSDANPSDFPFVTETDNAATALHEIVRIVERAETDKPSETMPEFDIRTKRFTVEILHERDTRS